MARVKKGVNAHKRHKKVLKQAKGFYGRRKRRTPRRISTLLKSRRSDSVLRSKTMT